MVMAVALGRAAKMGILIRRADVIELLAKPAHIYLDKTGTLTAGTLSVERLHLRTPADHHLTLDLIRTLECTVNHPAARALLAHAGPGSHLEVSSIIAASQGIEGLVSCASEATTPPALRSAFIGSLAFARSRNITLAPSIAAAADQLLAAGLSPVIIAIDHHAIAVAGLGDPIRPGTLQAIAHLQAQGHTLEILSGDHPSIVARVAHALGALPFQGGLTPHDKAAIVSSKQAQFLAAASPRRVFMVGDGVNDAPALARADVGIAAHGGAEASLKAAPIYLGTPGLATLIDLTRGASGVLRAIYFTIFISLAYNIIVAVLCIAGLVSPLWAAIIMPASSLSVTGIALIARTFIRRDKSDRALSNAALDASAPASAASSHPIESSGALA
jgi:cation transport ATPase